VAPEGVLSGASSFPSPELSSPKNVIPHPLAQGEAPW
jgi:hypothetical protein